MDGEFSFDTLEEPTKTKTINENNPEGSNETNNLQNVATEDDPLAPPKQQNLEMSQIMIPPVETDKTLLADSLNEKEKALVSQFVSKLNISDRNQIMSYGTSTESKINQCAEKILENTKTKDLGAVGADLTNLVSEINHFSAEDEEKGIFGFLNSSKNKMKKLAIKYDNVEDNIDKIVVKLEGHQQELSKDIAMLDMLYTSNLNYYKELTIFIVAGNEKLTNFIETDIENQRAVAVQSNSQLEMEKLNDLVASANRFDKRLHDLKISRTISIQLAPQIRMIQNNDIILQEKIQSSINQAIPLWKNQMVLALSMANSQKALEAQTKVSDMTNLMLQKNSELLKQGSLDIAKESEKSVVSIETVKITSNNLIETLNEVVSIQNEGRAKRREAEKELEIIEQNLKQGILKASQVTV